MVLVLKIVNVRIVEGVFAELVRIMRILRHLELCVWWC